MCVRVPSVVHAVLAVSFQIRYFGSYTSIKIRWMCTDCVLEETRPPSSSRAAAHVVVMAEDLTSAVRAREVT